MSGFLFFASSALAAPFLASLRELLCAGYYPSLLQAPYTLQSSGIAQKSNCLHPKPASTPAPDATASAAETPRPDRGRRCQARSAHARSWVLVTEKRQAHQADD